MNDRATQDQRAMLVALTPILFVLLWSTGFLGAKFGLPHAEPLTFLLIRFALVCAILLPIAIVLLVRRRRKIVSRM